MTDLPARSPLDPLRTPEGFRAARDALGLTMPEMADWLRLASEASVRKWEAGAHAVPGPVALALRFMQVARDRGWPLPSELEPQKRPPRGRPKKRSEVDELKAEVEKLRAKLGEREGAR